MSSNEETEKLDAKFQIFRNLSPEARDELSDMASWFETNEGNSLFQQGAPGLGIYLLAEGEVEQHHITPQGKKMIFALSGPGSILGTETLFNKENHISTAEVTSGKASVGFLERNNFFEFMKDCPSLLFGFADYLSTKTMANELKLVETSYLGSKQRISRLILSSSGSGISLSRTDLAQLTGVSYKTAIQVLGKLEERGLIETSEHEITAVDEEGLSSLANNLSLEIEDELLL